MPASSRTRATSSSPSSSNSSSTSSWKPYDRRRSPITSSPPNVCSRGPNRTRSIPRIKVPRTSPALRRPRQQRVESDVQAHLSAEADADGRSEADADTNVDADADANPAAANNTDSKADTNTDKSNTQSEPSPTTDPSADAGPDADILLDHPGLPTYATYKRIEADYLRGLSPRKRDKALITQVMFDKIWDVLHQPEACSIETPQFRFWVRKMFTLVRPTVGGGATGTVAGAGTGMAAGRGSAGIGMGIGWASMGRAAGTQADSDSEGEEADLELERAMGIGRAASTNELLLTAVVLHENRPVAIQEQLYELFCYCHVRAGHGGRDKTCAVIRQHYSWVPKELTAQFVKACPTCVRKKNGQAGVSVDVGPASGLVHRRASGQREKKGRVKVAAEEAPVSVVPSSLGGGEWPTTGGPLDPANPQPCGLREREREREREEAKTVGQSGPVSSPVDGHMTEPLLNVETWLSSGCGTGITPRTLTLDASPLTPCDATYSFGSPPPLAVELEHGSRTRNDREEKHSPRRTTTELPSLASALSNETFDDNVNLSGLGLDICNGSGPGDAVAVTDGECLPPTLRPLRLLGPVTSNDIELDPPLVASTSRSSFLFQIDPILLSFDYPGMSMDPWGLGTTASECYFPGTDVVPLSLDMSMSMSLSTGMIMETETMLPYGGEERLGECVRDPYPGPDPTRSPGLPGLYDRLRALSSDSDELDIPDVDLDLDMYAEGGLDADVDAESMHGFEIPELDRSTGSVDRDSSEDSRSPDSSLDGMVLTRTYGDTDKYLLEI